MKIFCHSTKGGCPGPEGNAEAPVRITGGPTGFNVGVTWEHGTGIIASQIPQRSFIHARLLSMSRQKIESDSTRPPADSWAQDGDDDDDFDTTSASENGDGRHDFGGDDFLQSELGFDGPLPAFPSDGRDPFFLDKEAPWPDQVEEFNPFDGDTSHATDGMKLNRARTESASGTDADETAQTMPSSSNSYDYSGDLPSLSLEPHFTNEDNTVPDRLDYLESKLRALQQERLSEDHVVCEDEAEI